MFGFVPSLLLFVPSFLSPLARGLVFMHGASAAAAVPPASASLAGLLLSQPFLSFSCLCRFDAVSVLGTAR
jgi:hypothetical protein